MAGSHLKSSGVTLTEGEGEQRRTKRDEVRPDIPSLAGPGWLYSEIAQASLSISHWQEWKQSPRTQLRQGERVMGESMHMNSEENTCLRMYICI